MSEFLNADELRGPSLLGKKQNDMRGTALRNLILAAEEALVVHGWTRSQLAERMEQGRKEYGEFIAKTDKRSTADFVSMILEEAADIVNYAGMGDAKEEAELEQRRLDALGDA